MRQKSEVKVLRMKSRRVLLVLLFVFGFYYLTTHMWHTGSVSALVGRIAPNLASTTANAPLGAFELTEAHAQPAYDTEEQNNIAVYKRVLPSVVNITSTAVAFDFFYGAVPQQGQGSGFVLDKQGLILTNNHVIENAQRVEVQLWDKHKYKAQIVNVDKAHDLALLKINAPNLVPVELASSSGLQVGQKVFAIGNPFGLSGTMTRGIISAIRSVRGPAGGGIEDAIQTDAAINPGNSGGPLMNSRGQVIGINTMIASNNGVDQSAGIGFAIPMNTARAVLDDIAKYGHVRRPTLAFLPLEIGPDLADQIGLPSDYGLLVQRVYPGGAAEIAGLKGGTQKAYLGNTPVMLGGDLIVAINGTEVTSMQDVSSVMNSHKAGDTVTVTVFRAKKRMEIKVTLTDAKDQQTTV
ncbi:peptidase S1 and S6 chymotrypsin/Hap [Terriglobus saanensis SP1PR4]|uniref:Peptidase S1 and S6 chymotrypsin/Hap n=2 Tax=Terriglobus saanensis TaxID=870903 RepID=E8V363_TERSS|nr:peptidase S1 and S6 chymotrypsin/Hap [Terriglobus saanensis SP1PR4]